MGSLKFIISLSLMTVLSVLYFVKRDYNLALLVWALGVFGFYILKSLRDQTRLLILMGLCFALLKVLHKTTPWLQWPLDFYLVSLFGFLFYRYISPRAPLRLKWSFAFSKWEWISVAAINGPAIGILFWYYQAHKEVANNWPVPSLPWWSLPFVILAIAAVNGLREEIFFRGLVQTASADRSPIWYIVSLQAVIFGFLHFANAFPQGWLGVLLTGIWGAAIAIQYHYFRSIALAWVTHSTADAIMFAIIIASKS